MLIFFCPAARAEARMPTSPHNEEALTGDFSPCTSAAAAAVGRAAQQISVGTPVEEALLSVRLRPEAAAETARSLATLGLLDVLDLHLLLLDGLHLRSRISCTHNNNQHMNVSCAYA